MASQSRQKGVRRLRAMQFALWAWQRNEGLPTNKEIAKQFGCGEDTASALVTDFLEARRPYMERANGPR